MSAVDVAGILERAGADANAPEGSQAWALAQVDAAVAELIAERDRMVAQLQSDPHAHLRGAHLGRPVAGCLLCEAMAERDQLRAALARCGASA